MVAPGATGDRADTPYLHNGKRLAEGVRNGRQPWTGITVGTIIGRRR